VSVCFFDSLVGEQFFSFLLVVVGAKEGDFVCSVPPHLGPAKLVVVVVYGQAADDTTETAFPADLALDSLRYVANSLARLVSR